MTRLKIILVANYRPDNQQSMLRFAQMLQEGLERAGHQVEVVRPEPRLLPLFKGAPAAVRKWIAYIDKYIFFPFALGGLHRRADLVHICDHSNAVYTYFVPGATLTCHDLLSVRGALGEDTGCPSTATGVLLQQWILSGLKRARFVICDSSSTQEDFRRLTRGRVGSTVVLLGMNRRYRRLDDTQVAERLRPWPTLLGAPYVLHVGANMQRKNRPGVLRTFARLKDDFPGSLVLAGETLDGPLAELADTLQIRERIVQVEKPEDDVLEALYNRAHVLLFPSLSEGFGWPPIEAQQCGCPVICSDRCSLPEVVGDGAQVFAVEAEDAMAQAILKLTDIEERARWVERGHANARRFTVEGMIEQYLEQFSQLAAAPSARRA